MRLDMDLGPLEANAAALARSWSARIAGQPQAGDDPIPQLLKEAQVLGDSRLAWLSQAWQTIALCNGQVRDEDIVAIEGIVRELQATGWSRAVRLAEAALAMTAVFTVDRRPAAIALLAAHGDAASDPRPAAERVWTDAIRSFLLTGIGRFDEALAAAQQAHRLAGLSGLPLAAFIAARANSYVFLSTGDVEGALGAIDLEMAAVQGSAIGRVSGRTNRLLALLLSDQPQRMREMLAADRWLDAPGLRAEQPTLACLTAWAHARSGDITAALARLPAGEAGRIGDEPQLRANRVWIAASVRLAAGQAARARDDVQAYLATCSEQRIPVSPMNGTQLHRVLSEACETLGDLPGALAALKASQQHCFTWVGSSVRTRLTVLQAEMAPDAEHHAQRLRAVDEAVRLSGQTAPAGQAEATPHRFLSHVAHEMRNPLSGLVGMTSLLMLSDLDDRQRNYVQLAQSSAQMLMQLCGDLLDLAKIEAGRFLLDLEPMDPGATLRKTVQMLEPIAQAKALPVQLQLDRDLPPALVGDPLRLQQLLMNLLSNAIKFTASGHIEVRARWQSDGQPQQGWLRVEVTDTGPGLDAAARARLFQEFVQLGRAQGGTGLGLALCRSLVEMMQGEIGVDSEPGQGSTFWFSLPLTRADAVAPTPA